MTNEATYVRCPNCKEPALYAKENPHRPFCSARCKGDDLVHWANGEYKIPVRPTDEDLEKIEDSLIGEEDAE